MMKKWQKRLLMLAIFLGVCLVGLGIMMSKAQDNLDGLVEMTISDVDLTSISDGVYKGTYDVFPVSVEVDVTVSNHEIAKIDLIKHFNGQGKPAEVIIDDVIEAQTLDVDVITGATYSSKIILKAIEVALTSDGK